MPTGGPSIDSNAMVGPADVEAEVVSEAFDVLVVVQPDASAASSAPTTHPTLRAYARFGPGLTTLAPPCGRRGGSFVPIICRDLSSAKPRRGPANYFVSAIALTCRP